MELAIGQFHLSFMQEIPKSYDVISFKHNTNADFHFSVAGKL